MVWAERVIVAAGACGGATSVVEGANHGANYFTLSSPSGAALSFTAAGLGQVNQPTAWVRPRVTLGSGASLTVAMTARRTLRQAAGTMLLYIVTRRLDGPTRILTSPPPATSP